MLSWQDARMGAVQEVNTIMMKQPLLASAIAAFLAASSLQSFAAPPKSPAPLLPKAGAVTALLPIARVTRGPANALATTDVKKGDDVFWNDLIRTEKAGRARVTLTDQSILSIGSQAELRIIKHDAKSQQTSIEINYGRVRADVNAITRQGGGFTVKTPTAVAGVIGTTFGTESSIGSTTFLCVHGTVKVGSSDPNITDSESCEPGMAVTVVAGRAPTKRPATAEEIQKFLQDTEPATIAALSPASIFIGATVDAIAGGANFAGIRSVSLTSGDALTATLSGAPTETSATVHLASPATANPGARVITFNRDNNKNLAAVVTLLTQPTLVGGDLTSLKKPYLDSIEQERQAEIASLSGVGISVKQSADGGAQQLTEANQRAYPPVNLTPAQNDLQSQVTEIDGAASQVSNAINAAVVQAQKDLDARVGAAYTDLLKRVPDGTPDDAFRSTINTTFTDVNNTMLAAFAAAHGDLGRRADTKNAQITVIVQDWIQRIATASPRWDNKEKSVEQGAVANFDANQLAATANSVSWQLCDPSYRPTNLGGALPANTGGCRPIPGYSSSTSDLSVDTCSLAPADYPVRVTLNGTTAYETYLHVARPSYDDPDVRLRGLAQAYGTLKPEAFMSYFDSAQYSGYAVLSENIRKTMATLSSMSVLVRIQSSSISCNTANLRADWQANYTFQNTATVLKQPAQQLTVRMARTPNQGWFITDFQGDSGTVQGVPPGPIQSDNAQPDLQITQVGLRAEAATSGPKPRGIALPTGAVQFQALVTNVGAAELTQPTKVKFEVSGSGLTTSAEADVLAPLAVGASQTVLATITLPDTIPSGTPLDLAVTVNPNNTLGEQRYDNNTTSVALTVGTIDLAITSISSGSFLGTQNATINVGVQNLGTGNFPGATQRLLLSFPATGFTARADLPAINAGQSVTVPITFAMPNVAGQQNITAAISPSVSGDVNTANDTSSGSVNVTLGVVDLQMQQLAFPLGAPPFISGQQRSVTFRVFNAGNINSSATDSWTCTLTSGARTTTLASGTLPAISADSTSALVTANFTVATNFAGAGTITCTASRDANEPANLLADNANTAPAQIDSNVDLFFSTPPDTTRSLQMGATGPVALSVKNAGLDDMPTGWSVTISLNNQTVGSLAGPALAGGATVDLNVPITVPVIGAPPQDITVPGSATILNPVVAETNTVNNVFTANIRLLDFALTYVPASLDGVVGRQFNAATLVSVAPSPYSLTLSYAGTPAGLTGNTVFPGALTGTPTTSGPSTLTVSGTATNTTVTHAAAGNLPITIHPEIVLTPVTTLSFQAGGPAQILTIHATGGATNLRLSLPAQLPQGITTTSQNTQVPDANGNVSWSLTADNTAQIAGNLVLPIHAVDDGFPSTTTAPGSVNLNVPYTINGTASYVVTAVSFQGHTAPYSGLNALQVGETPTLSFTIANQGNASPSGTLTLGIGCNPVGSCTTDTTTVPAPAAGTSATFSFPLGVFDLAPGAYVGFVDITAAPQPSTVTNISMPFESFDFALLGSAPNPIAPTQNIPVGGASDISFKLDETGVITTIPLTVAVSAPNSTGVNVSFGNPVAANSIVAAHLTVPAGMASGTTDAVAFTGTNRGISHSFSQPVKYYTAALTNQTITLNDQTHPLVLIKSAAQPSTFTLHFTGDFDDTGSAGSPLTINQGNVIGLTVTPTSTLIGRNTTFDVGIQAGPTATEIVSQIQFVLPIPNTSPQAFATYTLWILPQATVDLALSVLTTPNNSSSNLWLAGQSTTASITVQNLGTGISSGRDKIIFYVNGMQAGSTTVPSLNPQQQTPLNVSLTLPDSHNYFGSTTLQATLIPATQDTNSANDQTTTTVFASDWSLVVTSAGVTDATAITFSNPSVLTAAANVQINELANSPSLGNMTLVSGIVSPGFTSAIVNPALNRSVISSPVNLTLTNVSATAGFYLAQVVAQMHDVNGAVSAQRQATIHLSVTSGAAAQVVGMTASPDPQIVAPYPGTAPTHSLQINGLTTEAVQIGPTCTSCTGSTNLTISDAANATASPQSITALTFNTLSSVTVSPIEDASGTIIPAPATLVISATGSSPGLVPRTVGPDPTGNNQFQLAVNIGDLFVSQPTCTRIAPAQAASIRVDFLPVNGFNASQLALAWTDSSGGTIPGSTLQITGPSTVSFSNGYASPTYSFTNSSTGIDGGTVVLFSVQISSRTTGSTVTKFFPLVLDLSSAGALCGAVGPSVSGSGNVVHGYYKRSNINVSGLVRTARPAVATSASDLQVSAADITFSPSVPKAGDQVDVRFRIRNAGDAPAKQVPIALQVNGVTVATDTFDVAAGSSTLAALQWTDARAPRPLANSAMRSRRADDAAPADAVNRPLKLTVVVDPAHTTVQKSAAGKSALVGNLVFRDAPTSSPSSAVSAQRAILELSEGGCMALRFSTGPSPICGSNADVEINVEDMAAGKFTLVSQSGIADLGIAGPDQPTARNFAHQSVLTAGHTYAVQLSGGQVGTLNIVAVQNPQQLNLKAQKVFGKRGAKVMKQMAADGGAVEPGDTASGTTKPEAHVYLTISYSGQ